MEKHFMLDIESTGIDPGTEDLLSVGILELTWKNGLWEPGRSYEMLQHTDRKPESEFAKKHMTALYERCNAAPAVPAHIFRDTILSFFTDCGEKTPDIYLMGWNASNFDVPFLVQKGLLRPSFYVPGPDGKDVRVGDFHYRIYELGGSVSLAQNALGYDDRKKLLDDANEAYPMPLPGGKAHDALYDCYAQTKLLNGLIMLLRKR